MRLYIAGPMTGKPNYNFDAFNETAFFLANSKGHEVYNPASSFSGRQDLPYDMYLRHAVQLVSMCEGMVLLDGWDESKGALTEVHVGLSLDLAFFTLDLTETQPDIKPLNISYAELAARMWSKYGNTGPYTLLHSTGNGSTKVGYEQLLAV